MRASDAVPDCAVIMGADHGTASLRLERSRTTGVIVIGAATYAAIDVAAAAAYGEGQSDLVSSPASTKRPSPALRKPSSWLPREQK